MVSTVTATVFAYREASAARDERERNRAADRRAEGRRDALTTLTPLFAFVSDLEKVARASDRDPAGVSRYVQERTFQIWEDKVRPVLIGIEVSSSSPDARAAAQDVVRTVDDAIIGATFDLEFAGEDLDPDSQEEATLQLLDAIRRLRETAENLAALVRAYD